MLMGIQQCQGICEIGILLMHTNELKGYSDLEGRNVMGNAFCNQFATQHKTVQINVFSKQIKL